MIKTQAQIKELKVIILGSIGVGKTSLITRYKTGKFFENTPSTLAPNYANIEKIINNKKYELNIWDTAGQEKFNSLTQSFIKDAKIVLIVYSIIDKKSFEDLDFWLNLVKQTIGDKGYSLAVIANKNDLYLESEISDKKGKNYAKKINALWASTSAKKDDKGIEELMNQLIIDFIKIEEIEGIKRIESIRLDSKNTFEKQEEKGCCNNNNKKKTKNKIYYDNNKGSLDSYKEEKDKKEEKDEDIF